MFAYEATAGKTAWNRHYRTRATRPTQPNMKRPARRRLVITNIPENALTVIDTEARQWRISRGEAIARLAIAARAARREVYTANASGGEVAE